MKLELISIGNNWEAFSQRQSNPKFNKLKKKILDRDRFQCQYCGFMSGSQNVVNADYNYKNNRSSNMVTACDLCSHCHFFDRYSVDYVGGDKIIYLPELTQAELNRLTRVLMCYSQYKTGDTCYNAKKTLAQIQDRAQLLDKESGVAMSNPALYSHYISIKSINPQLKNKLRWLPALEGYQDKIEGWFQDLEFTDEDLGFELEANKNLKW